MLSLNDGGRVCLVGSYSAYIGELQYHRARKGGLPDQLDETRTPSTWVLRTVIRETQCLQKLPTHCLAGIRDGRDKADHVTKESIPWAGFAGRWVYSPWSMLLKYPSTSLKPKIQCL